MCVVKTLLDEFTKPRVSPHTRVLQANCQNAAGRSERKFERAAGRTTTEQILTCVRHRIAGLVTQILGAATCSPG